MAFEIEKGVPIPPPIASRQRYRFSEMAVGDSFFIPYPAGQKALVSNGRDRLLTAVTNAAAKPHPDRIGWKFDTRPVDGGVRCWRIK